MQFLKLVLAACLLAVASAATCDVFDDADQAAINTALQEKNKHIGQGVDLSVTTSTVSTFDFPCDEGHVLRRSDRMTYRCQGGGGDVAAIKNLTSCIGMSCSDLNPKMNQIKAALKNLNRDASNIEFGRRRWNVGVLQVPCIAGHKHENTSGTDKYVCTHDNDDEALMTLTRCVEEVVEDSVSSSSSRPESSSPGSSSTTSPSVSPAADVGRDCTIIGPSYIVVDQGSYMGVFSNITLEECLHHTANSDTYRLFHFYLAGDNAAGFCYLHRQGTVIRANDGRQRVVGQCF